MIRVLRLAPAVMVGLFVLIQFAAAQTAPPFKDLESFVKYVNAHHRAPFDRDSARLPEGAVTQIMKNAKAKTLKAASTAAGTHNVKVNQDRDPWPKAEVGSAVNPMNGADYVVMTNDFRENWDYEFYHTSTTGGATFSDDAMVGGFDPVTGGIPLTFQSDPGVAFDSVGHSVLSAITGNLIFDFNNGYENLDTEIQVAVGYGNGTYTSSLPMVVDFQPCNGTFTGVFTCAIQLDKPLITVDTVAGSPHLGTIYVYYTAFCVQSTPCKDGSATIPPFSSSILEAHAAAGLQFSAPKLVSGWHTQEQFSYLVIDSHGTPHMFFDDFTLASGVIRMYESTYNGSSWKLSSAPVASFNAIGTPASPNWFFRLNGTFAPGCGIHGDTAYCAFSANQIVGDPMESGLSVYLAVINTLTGASSVHRVNNDPFNDSKDHIFPWATAKADGSVYVGFYDDRNDPFNTKVEYFVAKSTDGGHTFPTQSAVSDTSFNPCVGFPGCGFFGDYTQLVSGPDGVVHAAWSDTRDGVSMQIYSQAVTW